ncbi:MAG TPA: helix-turn-helix domain-containing protein [Solirubrobacteraceae bacterium]|jgi:AcrR family transcriptional regulator|nr:helix-turn-helix domain-containing protein [Solirubrobacteraceae bacterium]
MYVKRSRQVERSEATRAALVTAARRLFARRGFGGVGTEEIVRAAGVTRGALYHQFDGKAELFAAVFEQLEGELAQRLVAAAAAAAAEDPVAALRAGAEAWLDACAEEEVRRIALLDAPAVLGFERWRAIGLRYGFGLVEGSLRAAMDAGQLPRGPVTALAHVLIGALDEAALYVATAEDAAAARAEVGTVLDRLMAALTAS